MLDWINKNFLLYWCGFFTGYEAIFSMFGTSWWVLLHIVAFIFQFMIFSDQLEERICNG